MKRERVSGKFTRKKHNNINKNFNKKTSLMIFLIFFCLSIVFLVTFIMLKYPRITFFSIKSMEDINNEVNIPEIISGSEVTSIKYKYSNNSGIIISTEPDINCKWKNPLYDDGYKICEAIFQVIDTREEKFRINTPKVDLSFLDDENIKNLEISYSQDYEVVKEDYNDLIIEQEGINVLYKDITIEKQKDDLGIQSENKPLINRIHVDFRKQLKYEQKLSYENIEINTREFDNFNKISNISIDILLKDNETNVSVQNTANESICKTICVNKQNFSLEDLNYSVASLFNESEIINNQSLINESTDIINNTSPSEIETYESNIIQSDQEIKEKNQDNGEITPRGDGRAISGFSISMFGGKNENEGLNIDSSKPFAIKVRFEIPKYSSNQFDFSISESEFNARIDPDVSACGMLDTEDSIYYLDQDIDSSGSCFYIVVNNVTLDCQGHSIIFTSTTPGEPSYGIHNDASNTIIKNCVLVENISSTGSSFGIYSLNSDGILLENNILNISGDSSTGIYLGTLTNVHLSDNDISINNQNSFGIYSDSSSNIDITRNNISILSGSSYGIYLTTNSNFVDINNNIITGIGDNIQEIYSINLFNLNISYNTFIMQDSVAYSAAIVSRSINDSLISRNNITLFGYEAFSMILSNSSHFLIEDNKIALSHSYCTGLYLLNNSRDNIITRNSIVSTGIESDNAILLYDNSNYNQFIDNTLEDYSSSGINIFNMYSDDNQFINNSLQNYGTYGYGFYIYYSDYNNISSNEIHSNSDYNSNIYLESGFYNEIIRNNISCYTLNNCYGVVYSLSNNNQFLFNNISTNGESSYGIDIYNSNNNNFFNNKINVSGTSAVGLIFDYYTNLNNFSNTDIFGMDGDSSCIYFNIKNHNFSFYNSVINSIDDHPEIYFNNNDYYTELNFTNINILDKFFESGLNGVITIKNYLNISVKSSITNDPIDNVNISIFDSNGSCIFSGLSSTEGTINRLELISYMQTGEDYIIDYSNYSIYAIYNDIFVNQSINLSSSQDIVLSLDVDYSYSPIISGSSSNSGSGGNSYTQKCNVSKLCDYWSECTNEEQNRLCRNVDINCNQNEIQEIRSCNVKPANKKSPKNILFDISLKMINNEVTIDDEIQAAVSLLNIGIPGKVEAHVNYSIYNKTNDLIYFEEEVIPVETQIEFIKNFGKFNLSLGEYYIIANLSYSGQIEPAISEDKFSVVNFSLKNLLMSKLVFYSLFVFVIFGLSLVLLRIFRERIKIFFSKRMQ